MPAGTPQKIATAPQLVKTITMLSKNEIETKFPKMGIWALSRISNGQVADLDVVSIGQTEITSLFAKNGKSYPILKIKENLNEQFSGPYVFVGPFGTADGALNFSKANPNHAINAVAAASIIPTTAPTKLPAPQKDKISAKKKSASELKKQVDEAIKSQLAGLMKEQSEIYKKFYSIIDEAKKQNRTNKVNHYEALKAAFIHSSAALNQNISALEYIAATHAATSPQEPLPSIGGTSIADMLMSCIECNAEIQKAFGKLYLGM